MLAIKERKTVENGKVFINIPEHFGKEVEIIVLSPRTTEPVEFWSEEEILHLGKTSSQKDFDKEDYSQW